MKILIIYYSRTGTTEKVAHVITDILKCDSEKIIDLKNRRGLLGYFFSGKDGMQRNMTTIGKMKTNPSNYDLVILGTPIWVNLPPAMRTYLHEYSGQFRRAAFFCTKGSSETEKLFEEMEHLSKAKPVSTISITSAQVQANTYKDMLDKFIKKIT